MNLCVCGVDYVCVCVVLQRVEDSSRDGPVGVRWTLWAKPGLSEILQQCRKQCFLNAQQLTDRFNLLDLTLAAVQAS